MAFKNYLIIGLGIMTISGQLAAADRGAGQLQRFKELLVREDLLQAEKCDRGDLLAMRKQCKRLINRANKSWKMSDKEKYMRDAYEWLFRLRSRISQDRECLSESDKSLINIYQLTRREWNKLNSLSQIDNDMIWVFTRNAETWVREITTPGRKFRINQYLRIREEGSDSKEMVGPQGIEDFYRSVNKQERHLQFIDEKLWPAKRILVAHSMSDWR